MANAKTCDRCGKTGAREVSASLAMLGVAAPDVPTGVTLKADACEACYAAVVGILHAHVVELLGEQGPLHAQIAEAASARLAAQQALDQYDRTTVRIENERIEAEQAAFAKANPKQPLPDPLTLIKPEVKATRVELLQAVDDAEKAHDVLQARATLAADQRAAAVRASLAA